MLLFLRGGGVAIDHGCVSPLPEFRHRTEEAIDFISQILLTGFWKELCFAFDTV